MLQKLQHLNNGMESDSCYRCYRQDANFSHSCHQCGHIGHIKEVCQSSSQGIRSLTKRSIGKMWRNWRKLQRRMNTLCLTCVLILTARALIWWLIKWMEYHYRWKLTQARHYLSYLHQPFGNCGQTGIWRTQWQIWWCAPVHNFKFWVQWMFRSIKPALDWQICHWQWWVLMDLVCLEQTGSKVYNLTGHESVNWMPSCVTATFQSVSRWTGPTVGIPSFNLCWSHCKTKTSFRPPLVPYSMWSLIEQELEQLV